MNELARFRINLEGAMPVESTGFNRVFIKAGYPETFRLYHYRMIQRIRSGAHRSLCAGVFFVLIHSGLLAQPVIWESAGGTHDTSAFICTASGAVLVAVNDSGVLRSVDDGVHWIPSNQGMTTTRIRCFAIDNLDRVYAGTARGVYRSSDDGVHWEMLGSELATVGISILSVDVPGLFFAGAEGDGLFRSTDDGLHWERSILAPTITVFHGLVTNTSLDVFVASRDSIYHSTDGGRLWTGIYLGFATGIQNLLLHSDASLYAATTTRGIMKSTDKGKNWLFLYPEPVGANTYNITVAPNGDLVVISLSKGIYRSSKGGPWLRTEPQCDFTEGISGLLVDRSNRYVFRCGATALYRCMNDGTDCRQLHGGILPDEWYIFSYPMTMTMDSQDNLYLAFNSRDMYVSRDAGETWSMRNSFWNLDFSGVLALASSDTGDLYAIDRLGSTTRIHRSVDGGMTWVPTPGLLNGAGRLYAIAVDGQGYVFIGAENGIFSSTDQGASWMRMSTPAGCSVFRSITAQAGDALFAGTATEGVVRSSDGGLNWHTCNSGLTDLRPRSFACKRNGEIYVGTEGSGVFRSTNNGDSWSAANAGIEQSTVLALATDPSGMIVAGTKFEGAFCSFDHGAHWDKANIGFAGKYPFPLLELTVSNLACDKSGRFFALTDSGIFRTIPRVLGIPPVPPASEVLCSAYPNPFVGRTTISLHVDTPAPVHIQVCDLLGRSVKNAGLHVLPAGHHAIPIDMAALPAGMYFCRIMTGRTISTVLLRLLR